jgi:hypothetical protein
LTLSTTRPATTKGKTLRAWTTSAYERACVCGTPYAESATIAAASNTPTAAGADGMIMDRPVAMTTRRPAAGDNPRSKPSKTNQKDTASTSHETSVHRKPTRPRRGLRSAMKPCIRFLTAASTRSGKRNGKRANGRRTKRIGRSP